METGARASQALLSWDEGWMVQTVEWLVAKFLGGDVQW